MIRILIVDDEILVRQGLKSLLMLEDDFEIIGEANHGSEAISLSTSLRPDVVLMDVRMPMVNGVEATRTIVQRHPEIKVLILTTFDDDQYITEAMKVGAKGYLLKDSSSERLSAAIRAIASGSTPLGPTILPKLISNLATSDNDKKKECESLFTKRELDVLKHLGRGLSNKEISNELHISEGTVKNHITRILSQLNLRDRTQAALWAQENLSF